MVNFSRSRRIYDGAPSALRAGIALFSASHNRWRADFFISGMLGAERELFWSRRRALLCEKGGGNSRRN
jgi:hypothetical protein